MAARWTTELLHPQFEVIQQGCVLSQMTCTRCHRVGGWVEKVLLPLVVNLMVWEGRVLQM